MNINDSNIRPTLTFRRLVYLHMQQLTNFPYIEQDFDALTDYELLCLVVKYLNDVIDNSNEQNTSITNLYNAFLELQTYMNNSVQELEDAWTDKTTELENAWTDKTTELETAFNNLQTWINNYFDNLDVQEEIDHKLDQMLEDGVLEQIIEQFLQSTALWCFDNVADMKAATNLIDGSYAKTFGYYNINDGGSATYKISNTYNATDYYETLNNGLYAILNEKTNINTMMFGAKNDKSEDVSSKLQSSINYVKNNATDNTLNFIKGDYLLNSEIYIPANFIILGNYSNLYGNFNGYVLGCNVTENNSTWVEPYSRYSCTIKNLGFYANTNDLTIYGINLGCSCLFEDLYFNGFTLAISQITQYVDSKTLKKIIVNNSKGDYDVEWKLGDGNTIQDCTEVNFKLTDNLGSNISSCNNCSFYLLGCTGISISNLHNENNRKCYIQDSSVTFKDCNIWKSPDEDENFEIKSTNNVCSVSLENINLWLRKTSVYNEIKKDINIDARSILFIKNVARCQERLNGVGIIKSHIRINNLNPILANEYIYKYGNISPVEKTTPYYCNYFITGLGKSTDSSFHGNYSSSDGTLYFRGTLYLDTTRLIKYPTQYGTNEQSVTITDDNTLLNLILSSADTPPNSILRLYRGTSSESYSHYTDVPIKDGFINLYDDKNFICKNFSQWIEGEQTYNQGLIAYSYKEINNLTFKNVQIYASSIPTYGTWTKGDIIINNNPSANGTYGWVCTTNGTPGTWKAISTIES